MQLSKHDKLAAALKYCQKVRYEPETGEIILLSSYSCTNKVGRRIGCQRKNGYRELTLYWEGKRFRVREHLFIWVYMTGEWPELSIDHIDRNPSNNKWKNLRLATMSQQMGNSSQPKKSKSGYVGVSWHQKSHMYRAQLMGKILGYFNCPIEAAAAYDRAAKTRWGDFYIPQLADAHPA